MSTDETFEPINGTNSSTLPRVEPGDNTTPIVVIPNSDTANLVGPGSPLDVLTSDEATVHPALLEEINNLRSDFSILLNDLKNGNIVAVIPQVEKTVFDAAIIPPVIQEAQNSVTKEVADIKAEFAQLKSDIEKTFSDFRHGNIFALAGDIGKIERDVKNDITQEELNARILGR